MQSKDYPWFQNDKTIDSVCGRIDAADGPCVECATPGGGKDGEDGRARALAVMLECAGAIEISSASASSLRATARERLEDMRALVPLPAAAKHGTQQQPASEPVLC